MNENRGLENERVTAIFMKAEPSAPIVRDDWGKGSIGTSRELYYVEKMRRTSRTGIFPGKTT
jgi:hypothetical protein